MSRKDKGKAPARRPFQVPPSAGTEPVIYARDTPVRLPRRLTDESQNQLIQKFTSAKYQPKRPLKPGYGTLGDKIMLRTNFFPIRLPKGPFWDYKVVIKTLAHERVESKGKGKERDTGQPPSIAGRSGRGSDSRISADMKRRIFSLLELEPSFAPFRPYAAHDYSQRIVAARPLPQPLEVVLKYIEEDEDYAREEAKVFHIFIELEREIDISTLVRYLNGEMHDYTDLQRTISALNLIMQQHASHTGVRLGRQDDNGASKYFFGPGERRIELARGVELWKGFFISVRPAFKQLMVNVNVCFSAFFEPRNLADALLAFKVRSMGAMPQDVSFANIRIRTQHTNFKKRVVEIGPASAQKTVFYWDELNREVTVEEYFNLKYQKTLSHADDLPVISIGVKETDGKLKHSWVPAELCDILPGNPRLGHLTADETRKMIKNACNPPWENAGAIVEKGLPSLGLTQDTSSLDGFNISIEPELAVVPGRVLLPPKVSYSTRPLAVRNGTWNLINNKFHLGARVQSWWYIHIKDGVHWDERRISELTNDFRAKAKEVGVVFTDRQPVSLTATLPPREGDDKIRSRALSVIRGVLTKQLAKESKPSFVLVLLERRDDDIYSGIKRIGDVELGIHTNHMLLENAFVRKEQYLANVALKLNVKLGGRNHTLDDPDMQWFRKKRTMLVGIDVTHAGPGSKPGTPSIAAVVANIDDAFVQFPASLRIQLCEENKEMLDELEEMMVERLLLYKKHNAKLPERILVFRDGVSEGQFKSVLKYEWPQINDAFKKLSAGEPKEYKPQLAIIICGKRHHTRFLATRSQDADNKGNTRPGTVVDRGITSVYDYDFYLQAHAGIQGTVRSTHYTVIYDNIKLGADEIQKNTNFASYMYARATRSVSLVPPAYYADLACERGRCYVNKFLTTEQPRARKATKEEKQRVYEDTKNYWGEGLHPDIRDKMFYI